MNSIMQYAQDIMGVTDDESLFFVGVCLQLQLRLLG